MRFNIKSKCGFTLIELLVVIGILAVLAAIAIPSVAGLIDRANVSADKTNANEMTNTIERFTSEYELYCQDIASGALDTSNLDSAQGRVKNVIGVTTRSGIEGIEFAQNVTVEDDVIAIYRDTKYPMNAYTMQKVVENYTKTSSSTFEPKQSDMHYWYSPDCGVVVFAEPDALSDKENKLNSQIQSGMDAKGNKLGADTQWIDLTLGASTNDDTNNVITAGATFDDGVTLTWNELKLAENCAKYGYDASAITDTTIGYDAFGCCSSLTSITIPDSVTSIGDSAFSGCSSLTSITIPDSVTSIGSDTFTDCTSLTSITIPDGVTSIDHDAFCNCTALTSITISDSVTSIGHCAFTGCTSLTTITFRGTKAQWNAITLGHDWNNTIPATVVHCTNGDITL